eukprot:CAMPEP_0182461430 /NCGR_PEP_ID=MMETSP1319-20130603/6011_1 /TAXON_ID=172717 /ORGANISM="Bolidomonas pacifica, Strain RCC208" /LENGTH=421 /DNA_ID=CAMNT_0024660719 /DNA_START=80 /DNA_END=1345 /DNA_ORIENTATION=+
MSQLYATAVIVDDESDAVAKQPSAPPYSENCPPTTSPLHRIPPINLVSEKSMANLRSSSDHSYPAGLANCLADMNSAFPLRIWIVDNSGSMATGDGNRVVTSSSGKTRVVPCTRWEEIQECVTYHARLAHELTARTKVRMLNPTPLSGEEMKIGLDGVSFADGAGKVTSAIRRLSPDGGTPLSRHIHAVRAEVESMRAPLEREGKKVCVVLATDGLPSTTTQDQFIRDLRTLEGLPVWVVIRLCTDEDNVTGFYNEIDNHVELSLEVLDDFSGEAKEVYECNPWLNYGLPLHRLREWGFNDKLVDLLDERALYPTEVKNFCALLFGVNAWDAPDPSTDYFAFRAWVKANLKKLKPTYNVITKRVEPWINIRQLDTKFRSATATSWINRVLYLLFIVFVANHLLHPLDPSGYVARASKHLGL